MSAPRFETAVFAGGCFWCLEAVFERLNGVERVVSGYTGGTAPNPSYDAVCTGLTGHAEALQVTFDPAGITSRDWSTYPILTFPELPEIKVMVIDRPAERSLGAGEAAQGPTAAAIANAVAHATGARLRDLPLLPERVKVAMG